MNHIEREILKLAVELYEKALAEGKRFTVFDLAEQLSAVLLERFAEENSVVRELIVMTAHSTMKRVDKDRMKPDPQLSLLDDLDRPVPVDDAQRVARRHMRSTDWTAHLEHVSANAARVNAAAAKEYARYRALAPYLAEGMNTEEAVAAWREYHEGEVLP